VRILFDTSALIPALVSGHANHSACLPYLNQALSGQIQDLISTHSLAELYSVLTRMPIEPKPSTQQVQLILSDLLQYLEPIPLVSQDYQVAISNMVEFNLPGGGIFDALIAQAALKANADILLTLNAKHFTRLGSAIATLVRTPQ
jgi:predicted nucleic acid-binding protein